MPLLIDCYNLLHEPMPPSLAGLDEAALCRILLKGAWAADRVSIVCDGVVKPGPAIVPPVASMEILYSGKERSADALIIECLNADTAPRRLTVVSTDHEIRKAARRRRARVLTSAEFVHLLVGIIRGPDLRPHAVRPDPADPTLTQDAEFSAAAQEAEAWLKLMNVDDKTRRVEAPRAAGSPGAGGGGGGGGSGGSVGGGPPTPPSTSAPPPSSKPTSPTPGPASSATPSEDADNWLRYWNPPTPPQKLKRK